MIFKAIFDFISNVITPMGKIIDDVVTTDEERLILKNELVKLENSMTVRMIEYESQLLESKTSIIVAEAQGQSFLQRSWRPITMLVFLALVVLDSFGLLEFRLSSEAWTLLQIGLGGYVTGRSLEKIATKVLTK